VEHVEIVPGGVPRKQLAGRGARGIIVVRGEEVRAKLDVQPGFWQGNMSTGAIVVASIFVDGPAGRLFGV